MTRDDVSVRKRVTVAALVAISVSLVLLGVPLAITTRTVLIDREVRRLQVLASQVALGIGGNFPTDIPEITAPAGVSAAVYDPNGARRAGTGPATPGPATSGALRGRPETTTSGGTILVVVPVTQSETVLAAVRIEEPLSRLNRAVGLAWGIELAAVVIALGAGVLVAQWQARALTKPLEQLAASATAITLGDLSVRAPGSRVREVNDLASSQNAMVNQLTTMIERERHLSADITHQLRTPLAGLRLELEAARETPCHGDDVIDQALVQVNRVQRTVDDILAAVRPESTPHHDDQIEVSALLAAARQRWLPMVARSGRVLVTNATPEDHSARMPRRVVEHVLDVLIDNAVTHGLGTITIGARDLGEVGAITVSDEGKLARGLDPFRRGQSTSGSTGIGLSLARTMAADIGGRLIVTNRDPTEITAFVPLTGTPTRHP